MELDRDYLYHCGGCGDADKNYPNRKTVCEHCNGSGNGNDIFQDEPEECGACDGYTARSVMMTQVNIHIVKTDITMKGMLENEWTKIIK